MDESNFRALLALLGQDAASDLHFRPGSAPKVRRKGLLETVEHEPTLTSADVEAIAAKTLADVEPDSFVDGNAAGTFTVDGLGRFRVRGFRQRGSVAVVVRRIPDEVGTLAELGLPRQVEVFAEAQHGLVLVAGTARSGRRSTLAAMLGHVNRTRAAHIVAVERPVELLHRDAVGSVSQLEVGADTPTFAHGIRAATEADGDVVVVSDITDADAVAAVMEAAEDGLLVLAGIDATGGVDAIRRFIGLLPRASQDVARLALAGRLVGTVAQRLAPKASGFGRVPVVEVVVATSRVRECLLDPETVPSIGAIVDRCDTVGMQSFSSATADLFAAGVIDLPGALTVADDWSRLFEVMQARGLIAG